MIDRCFICLATDGRCSQISTPEALVLIGLNWPALAEPGFMSHRSMVLGPPPIHRIMRLLCFFLRSGAAARSDCMNPMPGIARADNPATCLRKCRRLGMANSLHIG